MGSTGWQFGGNTGSRRVYRHFRTLPDTTGQDTAKKNSRTDGRVRVSLTDEAQAKGLPG